MNSFRRKGNSKRLSELFKATQLPCGRAKSLQSDAFRGGSCLLTQQGLVPLSLPDSYFLTPLL